MIQVEAARVDELRVRDQIMSNVYNEKGGLANGS